ncbi:unnamed protein product, partial [Cuscuta campestris]
MHRRRDTRWLFKSPNVKHLKNSYVLADQRVVLQETLPRLISGSAWACVKLDVQRSLEAAIDSNHRGEFIRILESRNEGNRFIYIPGGIYNEGPQLFFKALSTFVGRALQFGKDRGNGIETIKPSDILEVAVVGETVFDAHKSPSLDSKDMIELDAKQLHSSLLLNTYNGVAPSEISSDPHISILPRPDLSQEELESNQIGDLNLDKQELSHDMSSSLVKYDELEGNTLTEKASQRYNIQYPPLPKVLLSPFVAEFIPLMPNPYAAFFNHVEGLGKNSSLKDDEFNKIDDGNKVLCNNALEEIRDEREGPILYTHSEGEDKAFNDNILKPLQIDYSRMFKTPFDLGRDFAKLKDLKACLKLWNKNEFGHIFDNLNNAEKYATTTQQLYEDNPTDANRERAQEANARFLLATHKEVVYWKQNANAKWLEQGDMNSKVFHAFAN